MGGGSIRILCSPTTRNKPLKSSCFSSEKQDHCQNPCSTCFIMIYREETASFTVFVTLARMLASFGKSMMSSSGTVMNFRFGPLVREIKKMLLDGVTGITTCTAASTPFTTSRNFSFPSSISSMSLLSSLSDAGRRHPLRARRPWGSRMSASNEALHPFSPARPCGAKTPRLPGSARVPRAAEPVADALLHLATSARQQLVHLGDDHLRSCQIHVPDALPSDHTVLIDHIDVRNEFSPAVQLVGHFSGIEKVRVGNLDGECREKCADVLFRIP